MVRNMAPKRVTKRNERLIKLRESLGMSQTAFAETFLRLRLRAYQNYEATPHEQLPGPVQVIIEALENGGKIKR